MPIHLKETPTERAERAWRKERRRARKGAHRSPSRRHTKDRPVPDSTLPHGDFVFDLDDVPSSSHTNTPDPELYAAAEEARFREEMFSALAEDTSADDLHFSYTTYLQVPSRWAPRGHEAPDPELNEDQYAEWVRRGMWKRTHREEVEALERAEREREEKRRSERKWREEEARRDREKERKREEKRKAREEQGVRDAWNTYNSLWARMADLDTLTFASIPWPVLVHPDSVADLTSQAIRDFLLSPAHSKDKERKERHREALLRWHPDKFEGRWMAKVKESEKEKVREGVGAVVRSLGEL